MGNAESLPQLIPQVTPIGVSPQYIAPRPQTVSFPSDPMSSWRRGTIYDERGNCLFIIDGPTFGSKRVLRDPSGTAVMNVHSRSGRSGKIRRGESSSSGEQIALITSSSKHLQVSFTDSSGNPVSLRIRSLGRGNLEATAQPNGAPVAHLAVTSNGVFKKSTSTVSVAPGVDLALVVVAFSIFQCIETTTLAVVVAAAS